jgi:radical SAM protein with 4Fe4S-binding SPASM domain
MSSFENIGWTVGNHCNARCGHCYSWKVRKDSSEFLNKSDVIRIVDQLSRLGVKTVNLGGNEPIYTHGPAIRETILPFIIRTLRDANIPVGLTTNGVTFTYLDEHHREELMMINDIDFSLDSPFEDEHDANRGNKLHGLVLNAIQRSRSLGIDCSVIACGMRANFDEFHLEAYLALTKLLGSEFRINTLKPVEPVLLGEMPTAEQFYAGFTYLMNRSHCVTLGESCLTAFTETGSAGCPCGTTSFRINAKTKDGRVPINPCVYMHEFKVGDLLTEDIHDIVSSEQFRSFAGRRNNLPKECRESDCEYIERCRGGCTARSYLVHGDLDSKDPYCPRDFVAESGAAPDLPKRPDIGCHHGIRVHDNYLCTWIGEVDPGFEASGYPSLDRFRTRRADMSPLSGCQQDEGAAGPSLVRLRAKPTPDAPPTTVTEA